MGEAPHRRRPRPRVARGAAAVVATVLLAAVPVAGAAGTPGASAAPTGMPADAAWDASVRDARSWAVDRPGARVRFALRVDRRTRSFRGRETTHANSLVKATVLVAFLRRPAVRDRPLTAREHDLLSSMIRRSANAPVPVLLQEMGGVEPLRRVGRLVGMRDFRPVRVLWGASLISAVDEVRLFARLPAVLPSRHRDLALGLLRSVVPSQRWGMAPVAPQGWRVAFKSGWNDRGRVVQAMRLTCADHVVSASVLVDGADHAGSIGVVEGVGRRLLQPLRVRGARACSSVEPAAPPGT